MAKTQQTLEIEQILERVCRERRIYGCKEVTIGFPNNHMGGEICDFVTMDSYGILRCYEIKVSFSDLQSSAKMSWYGHYNYLDIPESMVEKITDYVHKITDFVGILVANDGQLSFFTESKDSEYFRIQGTESTGEHDPIVILQNGSISFPCGRADRSKATERTARNEEKL